MDIALQSTPPPLQSFVSRLWQEASYITPSPAPDYSLPSLSPSPSPLTSPSLEPSPAGTEESEPAPPTQSTIHSPKPSRPPYELSPPSHHLSPPWPKIEKQFSPTGKERDLPVGLITALSVAGIVLAAILTLLYWRRKRRRENVGFLSWKEHFYEEPPLRSPKGDFLRSITCILLPLLSLLLASFTIFCSLV